MQSSSVWFVVVVGVLAITSLVVVWRAGWLRLKPPAPADTRPGPSLGVLALVMGIGVWAMTIVASSLALVLVIAQRPPSSHAGGLAGAMTGVMSLSFVEQAQMLAMTYGVGIFVAALVWQAWRRRFEAAPKTPRLWTAAAMGVLAMVIAAPVVLMLSMLGQMVMTLVFNQPAPTLAHETLAALADDSQPLLWRGVMIAAVVLGAPIVEEVIYRGFLQTSLTKLTGRPWVAIGITTLVFVLMHAGAVPVEGWLPAALVLTAMSIAMSVAFARTGRLTTPIVLHVLYNAANVVGALVMA
jgi:uncharacterized protein